jgi:hypothetical protein
LGDRRLTSSEGALLREMQRDIAMLKRNRSTGVGASFALPFQMGDWRFEQTAGGGLRAINVDSGAEFTTGGGGSPGEPGEDGAPGEDGEDGAPGADGLSLRYGSGTPGVGVGVADEFYIDTTALTLWGPKDATLGWTGGGVPLTADPHYSMGYQGWNQGKIVGTWITPTVPSGGSTAFTPTSCGVPATGGMVFVPVCLPWQYTIDYLQYRIANFCTTPGAVARWGVYKASLSTGLPAGTATQICTDVLTSGGTNHRTLSIASPFTFLRNEPYWLCFQMSAVSALNINATNVMPAGRFTSTVTDQHPFAAVTTLGTALIKNHAGAVTYAAGFPVNPTFAATEAVSNAAVSGTPVVFMRCSA